MTREEAVTRLKNMAWLYGSTEREQNIEAIDMAIEALLEKSDDSKSFSDSAEPSVSAENPKVDEQIIQSGDLISRADAIEEISKGVWNVHELIDRINALPSADRPSIVRCGECKHWSEKEKQEAMSRRWTSICRYFSEYNENLVNEIYTGENAFCSYGERREP